MIFLDTILRNNPWSKWLKKNGYLIENFSVKDNGKGMRKGTDWENVFSKNTSDKRLLSKIYKKYLKINNKKQLSEPRTSINNSPKTIYRWKYACEKMLHMMLLRKCRLKTMGGKRSKMA